MALAETIAPFLWGAGGSKKTPEQVAREREIAAALMQGGMDYSPVDHWLQGAARAAQGGVGALKDRWANEAETAGRGAFQSQWDSVFGGGQAAPVQTAAIDPVAAALVGAPQTASDATAALAAVPSGDTAGYIRSGLLQRGLPEHVADAFLMNMQDESGLNPGINEASPTVPGSRGGFGLYQLTGPRRVAYEQYAQQLGVDPSNVDAQLDFMMNELQGPEANAYQSILAAPDTGSAAAAIVNDFLRPAEEHRARRVAQYTGGAPMQTAQAGGQPSIQELIGLASDPWANESQQQILQALMGQQLQQQDPAYQLDLALKQAQLDAANAPAGPEYGFTFAPDGSLIRTDSTSGTFDSMGQFGTPDDGLTDTQRNLAWRAEQAGLVQGTPEYAEFMRSGGQSTGMALSVGPDGTVSFAQGAGAGSKPLTENQSKLTLFQSLQTETQPVLLDLETQFDPSNIQDAAARSTPIAGNFFQSEQGQIYNSAATAWAEGALRIATGAAATPEEMERTKRAYFAQPGDTPNTIAFKAQMREMYNRAIQRSLGQETSGSLPKPSDFAQQVGNGSGTGTTSTGLKWSIVP